MSQSYKKSCMYCNKEIELSDKASGKWLPYNMDGSAHEMTKSKSVVKYRQSTFTFCGEKQTHRYKHTLLATITGPEARALLANKERDGNLYWHPVSNDKLEIYEDTLLPDTKKKAKTS